MRHGPNPDHLDKEGKAYSARARGLRSVLLTVADAANAEGMHSHPGIEGVMRGSLYGRRQSVTLLAQLVAEGWLIIEQEGGGRKLATVYSLPMVARNSATVAPADDGNSAISPHETVQSEPETVQSRLHPNGLNNELLNVRVRPASFPDVFLLTPEMVAWATEKTPGVNLTYETSQFADYWRGRADVKRTDWVASWRTWIRRAKKDMDEKQARGTGRRPGASPFQTMAEDWQTA